MSGKNVTRAEFVQKLTEMVKNGAKVEYFSTETPQKWAKTHNPAQDFDDSWANFGENDAGNVRTIIDGHLVDISWRRTLDYIKALEEAQK